MQPTQMHLCGVLQGTNSLLNELDDAMRRLNAGWLKEMENAWRKAQRDFKNVAWKTNFSSFHITTLLFSVANHN